MSGIDIQGNIKGNLRPGPVLTRDLLAAGGAEELVLQDDPNVRVLTEAERQASLDTFLRTRPPGDLWIFAYGSLIWNPAIKNTDVRVTRINNWHRSFCLSMTVGRGTPEAPGLALGLERGGNCHGVAYRIAEEDIATELPILWAREMLLGGYIPQWVELIDQNGIFFGHAVTFIVDPQHHLYAGELSSMDVALRLATASGSWGTAADYLFRTRDVLHVNDIYDVALEKLSALVEGLMQEAWLVEAA